MMFIIFFEKCVIIMEVLVVLLEIEFVKVVLREVLSEDTAQQTKRSSRLGL